jgi:hypothetical protein
VCSRSASDGAVTSPRTRTFDRIAIECTTGGGANSVTRLGIYADDAAFNFPGAKLLEIGTPLDTSASSATVLAATISQELTAGLWWLALVGQVAAATVRSTNTAVEAVPVADPTGTSNSGALTEAGVSGAMPATATPSAFTGSVPLVWLRAA